MTSGTMHNPDRFMIDLRQILSQGRKRIGFFIGAGAPLSMYVNEKNELNENGKPIIPDVVGLTKIVLSRLDTNEKKVIDQICDPTGNFTIEDILTKIRKLSQVIGDQKIFEFNGTEYEKLAKKICVEIGNIVAPYLPPSPNPYTEFTSWVGGIDRKYPIEIFTPNYDLLLEESFERAKLPYFDGFSGSHSPFFDAPSINDDSLPSRWSRIWKIHGSLGWDITGDSITRTGKRSSTELIYPEHLKYEHISRQPFSALFERLKNFLCTPDTLLICSGFSFLDAHITSVFEETLSANPHTSIIAFQFSEIDIKSPAAELAFKRPNLSVYGPEGAIISGVYGKWQPGKSPSDEWTNIRSTFLNVSEGKTKFSLGDFAQLMRFIALSKSEDLRSNIEPIDDETTDMVGEDAQ